MSNSFNTVNYVMGIGDWGLGIGDWAIPNPQSPIPIYNTHKISNY